MVIVIIQKRKKVKKKRKVSEKDTLESSGSQSWKVANGKELGKRNPKFCNICRGQICHLTLHMCSFQISIQLTPELSFSTEPNIQHTSTKIHDQHLPQQFGTNSTHTLCASAGSHDQFLPEYPTQTNTPQTYTTTQVEEPH